MPNELIKQDAPITDSQVRRNIVSDQVFQNMRSLNQAPSSGSESPKYGEYGWAGLPWEGGFWGGLPHRQEARAHKRRQAQAGLAQQQELRQWLELADKQAQEEKVNNRTELKRATGYLSDSKFYNSLGHIGQWNLVNSARELYTKTYGRKIPLLKAGELPPDNTPQLSKDFSNIMEKAEKENWSSEQEDRVLWNAARGSAARGETDPNVARLFEPKEPTSTTQEKSDIQEARERRLETQRQEGRVELAKLRPPKQPSTTEFERLRAEAIEAFKKGDEAAAEAVFGSAGYDNAADMAEDIANMFATNKDENFLTSTINWLLSPTGFKLTSRSRSPQSVQQLPDGVSEESIERTMKEEDMTRQEVIDFVNKQRGK
jgi:hypothetical protein